MDTPLSGKAWALACGFHPWDTSAVLEEVQRRVYILNSSVDILDLDSTLYEVSSRSHQILREWSEANESEEFSILRSAFAEMPAHAVGYSIKDTFKNLGFDISVHSHALESAKKFWQSRFFTSEYLQFDRAYTGAAEFARDIYAQGAQIVYLTGRDEPNMGKGTRSRLLEDGFPLDVPRTSLFMKPQREMDDLLYKRSAADRVQRLGAVVASFENEPLNLVALSDLLPDSMHVFVDTVCSDHPASPRNGLFRITDFERKK